MIFEDILLQDSKWMSKMSYYTYRTSLNYAFKLAVALWEYLFSLRADLQDKQCSNWGFDVIYIQLMHVPFF